MANEAHCSQTGSGIRPIRINTANALQPRQIPAKASSDAATTSPPMSTMPNVWLSNTSHAIDAAPETSSPIAWAKRLGGPAVSLGWI